MKLRGTKQPDFSTPLFYCLFSLPLEINRCHTFTPQQQLSAACKKSQGHRSTLLVGVFWCQTQNKENISHKPNDLESQLPSAKGVQEGGRSRAGEGTTFSKEPSRR